MRKIPDAAEGNRTETGKKRIKRRTVTVCGCVLLCILLGIELFYSNTVLTVSEYRMESQKVSAPIRIVLLTDLHGRSFGKENVRLLDTIAAQQPDLIALTGDIFNKDADTDEVNRMCGFIQKAAEIAPVYFGLGNHEAERVATYDGDLLERIRQSGAVVLEAEYLDLEINGTPVRIGGYMGYYRTPHLNTKDPVLKIWYERFFSDFENTDRFKILLNHIPTNWVDWGGIDTFPVDLVLSGHYHGGLIRIPFLEQGLVAPYVGLFPPYTKGMFTGSKATCILTTGLAGSRLPRLFNPPEIAVVDILPAA